MTDTQQQPVSATQHTDNRNDDATHGHTTNTDTCTDNEATRTYTMADDIRDITSAIVDTFRWITSFSLTDFLCRIMGHGFDPEGCRLPEWKFDPEAKEAFAVIPNEYLRPEGEGWAVYDKVIYGNARIVKQEEADAEVLTQREIIALHQYNPPLRNLPLAKRVKYHLKKGMNDKEISVLTGYDLQYIKHYRLAFRKASEN